MNDIGHSKMGYGIIQYGIIDSPTHSVRSRGGAILSSQARLCQKDFLYVRINGIVTPERNEK